ncbi:MAG TPA: hypothetical protein VFV41_13775 [Streptosporangiaceae bacterium]|nr:hypothetical protein [Streptosporangiaceae bacterium]
MTGSRARSVSLSTQRMLAAGLAAAALAAGAAGCGSTSGGTGGSTAANPLASLSGAQIADKAVANLSKASSVHVAGTVTSSGQKIGLDLRLSHGKGCVGSMTLGGKGSFRLIAIGKKVWLKPNRKFWHSFGGSDPAVLKLLSGKYLKTTMSGQMGGLAKICDPAELAGAFHEKGGHLTKGPVTTVAGQPAIKLTDNGDSSYAYVSATSTPQLLQIAQPGSDGGQVNFTGYGDPVTLSPPPAAQTLDGKKYGF